MSAYRFCRSDDIGLLVDALNHCWTPYVTDEPPMTPAAFKRWIRDLQVWCSSCMVAFAGSEPIGVLIGAKRPAATLVHTIAVHPDHRRQGHGLHLLTSLASKLAILGPPRIVAEIPDSLAAARGLLSAGGYAQEACLTDYVLARDEAVSGAELTPAQRRFVIPVTVDDLAANGLLGEADPQTCWRRSVETLMAKKDSISGLAIASAERIEAYLLYVMSAASPDDTPAAGPQAATSDVDIVSLRSLVDNDAADLRQLVAALGASGSGTVRFAKVHPSEFSLETMGMLGFRPAGTHLLYAATPRSE